MILGSRRAPVTGQQSEMLRFLALNQDYSIISNCNRFGPTKMNSLALAYGPENTLSVSLLIIIVAYFWK